MSKEPLPPVLKLNVSGTLFYIKTSLIVNDNRPLAKMFNSELDRPYKLEDGSYYIEAHPECFSAVLDFYRYGRLLQPPGVDREFFEDQLTYWCIDTLSDTETEMQLSDLVHSMQWPVILNESKWKKKEVPEWFTLAIGVGPGKTGWVPNDLGIFMVAAIYSEHPYTLSIGQTLISWPLEEPIIPNWMIGGTLKGRMGYDGAPVLDDILLRQTFDDFVIASDEEQVILLKCSSKQIVDPEFWLKWVGTRTQTKPCYVRDKSMLHAAKALRHFDNYQWDDIHAFAHNENEGFF